jgi:hypothetical protein
VDFAPSRLLPKLKQGLGMIANRRTEIVVAALVDLDIEDLRHDPAVLEEVVCGRFEPTDALMSALTGDSGIHLRFGDTGRTRATFETLALWAPPEFPVGPEQADLGRRQLSIVT